MSPEELKKKLSELERELMKERASSAIKAAAKSPGKIRAIRTAIAQIRTMLRKRNLK